MKGPVKVVVGILVGIVAVVVLIFAVQYRAQVSKYNDAINLINDGRVTEGVAALEEFYKSSTGSLQARAKEDLLKSYRNLASDPAKPMKESVKWLHKINDLDPAQLTGSDRQMMSVSARKDELLAGAATQPATNPAPAQK